MKTGCPLVPVTPFFQRQTSCFLTFYFFVGLPLMTYLIILHEGKELKYLYAEFFQDHSKLE